MQPAQFEQFYPAPGNGSGPKLLETRYPLEPVARDRARLPQLQRLLAGFAGGAPPDDRRETIPER